MTSTPRRSLLALAVAAAAIAAAAPSAHAAGQLAYSDDGRALWWVGDDGDDVVPVDGLSEGGVQYAGFGSSDVTGPVPGECREDTWMGYVCPIPADGVVLAGNGGVDSFFTLSGFPASAVLGMVGGAGNDRLRDDTRSGPSIILGGEGNDEIQAGAGDDLVDGEGGNDTVNGMEGSDEVHGGAGNDVITGDGYADPGADIVDGGEGVDKLEEYSQPSASFNPPVAISLDGVANDGRPGEGDNVTAVEDIVSHVNGTFAGSNAGERITVWANIGNGDSTITGLGGDDVITGMDYVETIDGGAGNDKLEGGLNHDVITGGPGRDTLYGEGDGNYCGIYECKVPFGNDTINARDGEADQVDCGVGTDTAIVDALDTVANCEKVDVGGGGSGGPGVPDPPKGGGAPADGLTVAAKVKRATLLKRGLGVQVACAAACKVSARLTVKGAKLGAGSRALVAPGTAKLTVRLTAAGKRRLRKSGKAPVKLSVTVVDAGGKRTLSRTVSVRR